METLKHALKDAVRDNRVENEREPLMQLLMQKAREMGLLTGNPGVSPASA